MACAANNLNRFDGPGDGVVRHSVHPVPHLPRYRVPRPGGRRCGPVPALEPQPRAKTGVRMRGGGSGVGHVIEMSRDRAPVDTHLRPTAVKRSGLGQGARRPIECGLPESLPRLVFESYFSPGRCAEFLRKTTSICVRARLRERYHARSL